MDIPKHSINSDNKLTPQTEQTTRQQAAPTSNVQDLKLVEGKVYSGRVISQNPPASSAIANPSQTLASNNEWLVQVKGQTIIISSEKALENGQKLLLKLDPSSTPEKPSLIAQLLNTKPSVGNPTQHSKGLTKLLGANQTLDSGIKASSSANRVLLEQNLVKPLLQAINMTLDKQTPLQKGFDQISLLLPKLAASTKIISEPHPLNVDPKSIVLKNLDPKLAESIKQIVLDKLPKLNHILNTNQPSMSTTQLSGSYLKQNLIDSGLFFEKNLLSKPVSLNAFKDQLNKLNQLLTHPTNQSSNQSVSLKSHLTQGQQLNQSLSQSPAQLANAAREKIQQTIESLLQLASSTPSKQNTGKSPNEVIQQFSDLKANLLSASALLIKQLSTEISEAELKNIFLGQTPDATLASPFAFPIISNTQINQSKALFDSQELTTGQLLKLLAGMIHKLQFNQLNSLMQSNSGVESALQQTWFFELPILNPNQTVQTFNFRLNKEKKESKDEVSTNDNELQWKLLLSFDLASLGPIYVQVSLSDNTISPILWADQQSTLELLEKESAHFKDQLENIGLNVSDILCQKGQPSTKQAQLNRHLVDTKA